MAKPVWTATDEGVTYEAPEQGAPGAEVGYDRPLGLTRYGLRISDIIVVDILDALILGLLVAILVAVLI